MMDDRRWMINGLWISWRMAGNGKIGCPLPVMGPSYDAMNDLRLSLSLLSPLASRLLPFVFRRLPIVQSCA
jgi:hypothetical protein